MALIPTFFTPRAIRPDGAIIPGLLFCTHQRVNGYLMSMADRDGFIWF